MSELARRGAGLFSFRFLAEERDAAYARGLEDAAKAASNLELLREPDYAHPHYKRDLRLEPIELEGRLRAQSRIAAAIRALKPGYDAPHD